MDFSLHVLHVVSVVIGFILYGGFSQATNVTVTFTARHHMVGDEYHFLFMCISDGAPQGCSVEFLRNNRTIDTLRESADKCYHMKKECMGDECSCSSDCMNFTLKYTTENRTGDNFSCIMRIKAQGIGMDIYDYVVSDGFVFKSSKQTTVTQSGVDEPTIKESSDNTAVLIVGIGLPVLFLCIIIGGDVYYNITMRKKGGQFYWLRKPDSPKTTSKLLIKTLANYYKLGIKYTPPWTGKLQDSRYKCLTTSDGNWKEFHNRLSVSHETLKKADI